MTKADNVIVEIIVIKHASCQLEKVIKKNVKEIDWN